MSRSTLKNTWLQLNSKGQSCFKPFLSIINDKTTQMFSFRVKIQPNIQIFFKIKFLFCVLGL